jgi:hypothetical protein
MDPIDTDRSKGVPVLRSWIIQAQPLPLLNNFDIQSTKRSACALVARSGG